MKRAWSLLAALAAMSCGKDEPAAPDGAAQIDAPPAPRQIVMEPKALGVGELVEATLTGGPQDRGVIKLTGAALKLDWNIHGHAGGSAQTVVEDRGVTGVEYTFTPPSQADWSLLLRNAGTAPATVDVEIELYGDLQWGGWQ